MRHIFCWLSVLMFLACEHNAQAKTMLVKGKMSAKIRLSQQNVFSVKTSTDFFTYRLPLPSSETGSFGSQKIDQYKVDSTPNPSLVEDTTDAYGNRYRTITWNKLKQDAQVTISSEIVLSDVLSPASSNAPFPTAVVPSGELLYLKATEQVQSESSSIRAKARELTAGSRNQHEAVSAIMQFVANHITYSYNPKQYDALYSLQTGDGNCQNYAHLALALLRASGIPGRAVCGFTLDDKWRVSAGVGSSIVYSSAQGKHAWLEVWYPDLGWLPYDPQQSMQFVSTRHVKETHGPQVSGITGYWSSTSPAPDLHEQVNSEYLEDRIDLSYEGEADEPKQYVLSNLMLQKTAAPQPPPVRPAPVVLPVLPVIPVIPVIPPEAMQPEPAKIKSEGPKSQPDKPPVTPVPKPQITPTPKPQVAPEPKPLAKQPVSGDVVFGNKEFPDLVAVYKTIGNTTSPSFSSETAEYATSNTIYAQAFTVERTMDMKSLGLAMKKFGGSGSVYTDVVVDENGKPGMNGARSLPIDLDSISKTPGYAWVDFTFPASDAHFKPGKYWIVLRHSGEAVMNWFFTPGKRYGGADDTRSTARGWEWEDLLTYEFVFRVKGNL